MVGGADDGTDVVEVEVVAAVGRGHAPGRDVAVEGRGGADDVGAHAENAGGHLGRGGLVGLAAVGGTQVEGDGAVLLKLDGGAVDAAGPRRLLHLGKDRHVPGGVAAAGLHPDDHADAEVAALLPLPGLLFLEGRVVHLLQRALQQAGIVAAVVDVAVGRGVGHLLRLHQVLEAYRRGVHVQVLRHPVDDAFPDVAHARLADAPVGDHRTPVGDHRVALHADVLGLVGVAEVVELVGEMDGERAHGAAHVVDFLEAQPGYGAVVLHRGLDVEFLLAGVAGGHHVLVPVLDPLHRPAGLHGQQRHDHHVLPDQMDLLSEAAADVRDDDPDVVQAQGVPQRVVDVLRHLGVGADRELFAEPVEGGDARQRLQGRRAVPVDLEVLPHHPVGLPERGLGVAVFQGPLPGHVGTQFFIDERRILAGHGLVDVADGRQDLVVHRNGFQDVFGRAPVPGRDGAHGLTHVADLVHCSGVFLHGLLQAGGVAARPKRFGVPLHVLGRHHGEHVLPALGGLRVHPENARVGVGTPYEHGLQHAGFGEIVSVLTPSRYVPRPLLAARGEADIFIRASHFYPAPRLPSPPPRSAYTPCTCTDSPPDPRESPPRWGPGSCSTESGPP